jgi:hypothetical protein
MPIARLSYKLPDTHPSFSPRIESPDTSNITIKSVASGTNAAVLSIPASAVDVDGIRFGLYIAGRIKLYSGTTPGNFSLTVQQGPFVQNLHVDTFALPASASGLYLPFYSQYQLFYDAQSRQLSGFTSGIFGNASNGLQVSPTPFIAGSPIDPSNLAFDAYVHFSVQPGSMTTVEILEFRM